MYELSADVCAAAANQPELLKCVQALVCTLHPAVTAHACAKAGIDESKAGIDESKAGWVSGTGSDDRVVDSAGSQEGNTARGGSACAHAGNSNGTGGRGATSGCAGAVGGIGRSGRGVAVTSASPRAAEFAAAQLLFFSCVPVPRAPLDVYSTLRSGAAAQHWRSAEMGYAVEILQVGDMRWATCRGLYALGNM